MVSLASYNMATATTDDFVSLDEDQSFSTLQDLAPESNAVAPSTSDYNSSDQGAGYTELSGNSEYYDDPLPGPPDAPGGQYENSAPDQYPGDIELAPLGPSGAIPNQEYEQRDENVPSSETDTKKKGSSLTIFIIITLVMIVLLIIIVGIAWYLNKGGKSVFKPYDPDLPPQMIYLNACDEPTKT
jgi:hypothetical protein